MHKIRTKVATSLGVFASASQATLCDSSDTLPRSRADTAILKTALAPIRQDEVAMLKRWEDDEDGFRKLPPRAWPAYQPDAEELPTLRQRQATACKPTVGTPAASNSSSTACETATFDLASCLVFNSLDPMEALQIYRSLADKGHADAEVAVGVLLTEGLAGEGAVDEAEGVRRLKDAAGKGHAQGCYELGTAVYTGVATASSSSNSNTTNSCSESESDAEAFLLFEAAAAQAHTGGLFMAGEMLLEGEGVSRDLPRGVRLLHAAAEQGHRFGRQRVRRLLKETR
eukprot:GSChrysophyteH2.ASY1.ANO1.1600.1 assembled CDS